MTLNNISNRGDNYRDDNVNSIHHNNRRNSSNNNNPNHHDGKITHCKLLVPNVTVGSLIGRNGLKIQQMRRDSGKEQPGKRFRVSSV